MKHYKVKKSKIDNLGVYAAANIKAGTKIIYYKGKIITKKETEINPKYDNDKAIYLFNLNSRYDLDGDFKFNTARLINHSCEPNCEVEITDNQIWISSIKKVKKDDELTYNYGYPFDSDFDDHVCKCGSKKCVGFILSYDDWPKLKKALNKKNNLINQNPFGINM